MVIRLKTTVFCSLCITFSTLVNFGDGWRAVPASQAKYALRGAYGIKREWGDDLLIRKYLHSTYKFGYCTPLTTIKEYLKKTINLTFVSFNETDVRYIYLMTHLSAYRHFMQCVVMKLYTAGKFLFVHSRFPMYYCQGAVHLITLRTIHRFAINEFYINTLFKIPANIVFEFYHPALD